MKLKNVNDVTQKELKLTIEEINGVNAFANLSDEDSAAIADFIYTLSVILYKTNDYEKSGLL